MIPVSGIIHGEFGMVVPREKTYKFLFGCSICRSNTRVRIGRHKQNNHLALGILFGMLAYWANLNRHYHDEHTIDLAVMIVFGVLSIYQLFLLFRNLIEKKVN